MRGRITVICSGLLMSSRIQREQHLVEAVYVEIRRKPFQSRNAEMSKCYRMPALKDRI